MHAQSDQKKSQRFMRHNQKIFKVHSTRILSDKMHMVTCLEEIILHLANNIDDKNGLSGTFTLRRRMPLKMYNSCIQYLYEVLFNVLYPQ